MSSYKHIVIIIAICIVLTVLTGCQERELTVITEPAGALVELNDEQIGVSPVTVSFNWYGDYNVRISKAGFETLKTHRLLRAPWYDKFPFDLFASMFSRSRPGSGYEWQFALKPYNEPDREQLIKDAEAFKNKAVTDLVQAKSKEFEVD